MNDRILKGKIEFFEKFGQMLNSGVPLTEAICILSKELNVAEVKVEVIQIVEELKNLESTKKKFYECFNESFFNVSTLAMIKEGERLGQLDYVCIKIANCLRAELAVNS